MRSDFGKRSYSDADKAAALVALDANGGNLKRTAEQLGIPEPTLRQWSKGRTNADVEAMREGAKVDLADRLERVVGVLLAAAVDPDKVEGASLKDVMTGAGIAIDKMQLLRGEPTAINEDRLSDDERADRVAAILERARARRDGQAPRVAEA